MSPLAWRRDAVVDGRVRQTASHGKRGRRAPCIPWLVAPHGRRRRGWLAGHWAGTHGPCGPSAVLRPGVIGPNRRRLCTPSTGPGPPRDSPRGAGHEWFDRVVLKAGGLATARHGGGPGPATAHGPSRAARVRPGWVVFEPGPLGFSSAGVPTAHRKGRAAREPRVSWLVFANGRAIPAHG